MWAEELSLQLSLVESVGRCGRYISMLIDTLCHSKYPGSIPDTHTPDSGEEQHFGKRLG